MVVQRDGFAIDLFLADPIVSAWMVEPADATRCKYAYHIDLTFVVASDEEILEAIFYISICSILPTTTTEAFPWATW